MKIVAVGDIIVSEALLAQAASSLNVGEKAEIIEMFWPARDRKDFQRKALNLEMNGPDAEEIPNELYEEVRDADILLVHFCPVSRRLIEAGKKLKLIGTCRGGMEHIDVQAATEKNIPVIHVIRNAEATSDFTVGLMFAETRNIARAHAALKEGIWRKEICEFRIYNSNARDDSRNRGAGSHWEAGCRESYRNGDESDCL